MRLGTDKVTFTTYFVENKKMAMNGIQTNILIKVLPDVSGIMLQHLLSILPDIIGVLYLIQKHFYYYYYYQIMKLEIEEIAAPRSFVFLWCGSGEGLDLGRVVR